MNFECIFRKPSYLVIKLLVLLCRNKYDEAKNIIDIYNKYNTVSNFKEIEEITGRECSTSQEATVNIQNWLQWKDSPEYLDPQYIFERYYIGKYIVNPEELSLHKLLDSIGFYSHNSFLTLEPSNLLDNYYLNLSTDTLKLLSKINISENKDHELSIKVLKWECNRQILEYKYRYYFYGIDHMVGIHSMILEFLTDGHSFDNEYGFITYTNRLKQIPIKIDLVIKRLWEQIKHKVCIPGFVIENILSSIKKILESKIKKNVLYTKIIELYPSDVKKHEKVSFILLNYVIPSYERLEKTLKKLCIRKTDGVSDLPNGEEFYKFCLFRNTTTRMSPENIHKLGLSEVKKIHTQMKQVMVQKLGESESIDPCKFVGELNAQKTNPEFFYVKREGENDEQIRQRCMNDFTELCKKYDAKLDDYFDIFPTQRIPEMKPIPEYRAHVSAGAYYWRPSFDGSKKGTFYINLYNLGAVQKYSMPTLTVHEAIPGHHYQLALSSENKSIPLFRKSDGHTAYWEGWALYAEKLALEKGFFETPYEELGHYGDELLRAARLVVDTGIHYYKWTREKSIKYMLENTIADKDEIKREVDRYCVWPGQACSYKIGQLKLLEFRERMNNLKDFHRIILENSSMPLEIIDDIIN